MLTRFLLLPGLYFVFADVDRLRMSAQPAAAIVAVQQDGRDFLNLPELEFELSISPHCAERAHRESLSITIADTRITLRGEALQADETVDVTMRVPASQLAPFTLKGFCVRHELEGESIFLDSVLTAQASLRCTREGKRSIVFAAESLDVRLDCIRSATGAGTTVY